MEPATDLRKLLTVINRLLDIGFDLQLPADTTEATLIRDLTVLADVIDPPRKEAEPDEIGRMLVEDVAGMMLSRRSPGRRRLSASSGRRADPGRTKKLAEVINGRRSIDDPSL